MPNLINLPPFTEDGDVCVVVETPQRRLAGVDHIIRGGDIGRPEIIDALRRIAPCYRDPRKRGYRRLGCCIP